MTSHNETQNSSTEYIFHSTDNEFKTINKQKDKSQV